MPGVVVVLIVVAAFVLMRGSSSGGTAGTSSADGTGPPGCGGVGGFIKGHVDRKNQVAPGVISKYTGASGGTAKEIANIAGKLDVSAYAENYIGDHLGNALCNVDPLGAAAAGAKFLGHEIAAGAEYVGGKIADGAKAVGSGAVGAFKAPLSTATSVGSKGISIGNKIATSTNGLVDRGVNTAYSKLPAPLKLAAAPALAVQKLSSKTVGIATSAASAAGRGIVSGAKTAEHAVSSAANTVLGWL